MFTPSCDEAGTCVALFPVTCLGPSGDSILHVYSGAGRQVLVLLTTNYRGVAEQSGDREIASEAGLMKCGTPSRKKGVDAVRAVGHARR